MDKGMRSEHVSREQFHALALRLALAIRGASLRPWRLLRSAGAVYDRLTFPATDGAVDPWRAGQLLLPPACAGMSLRLPISEVTTQRLTNAAVIRWFLRSGSPPGGG
jgi:hypothetical protein